MPSGALFTIVSLGPKLTEVPSQPALQPAGTNVVERMRARKGDAHSAHISLAKASCAATPNFRGEGKCIPPGRNKNQNTSEQT